MSIVCPPTRFARRQFLQTANRLIRTAGVIIRLSERVGLPAAWTTRCTALVLGETALRLYADRRDSREEAAAVFALGANRPQQGMKCMRQKLASCLGAATRAVRRG